MKITKTRLRQIISEVISRILDDDIDEVRFCLQSRNTGVSPYVTEEDLHDFFNSHGGGVTRFSRCRHDALGGLTSSDRSTDASDAFPITEVSDCFPK